MKHKRWQTLDDADRVRRLTRLDLRQLTGGQGGDDDDDNPPLPHPPW